MTDQLETLRAELAQTKVHLHQLATSLSTQIGALDIAFKTIEDLIARLPTGVTGEEAEGHRQCLRGVRSQILGARNLIGWHRPT